MCSDSTNGSIVLAKSEAQILFDGDPIPYELLSLRASLGRVFSLVLEIQDVPFPCPELFTYSKSINMRDQRDGNTSVTAWVITHMMTPHL